MDDDADEEHVILKKYGLEIFRIQTAPAWRIPG
jgi:hypothetical protein